MAETLSILMPVYNELATLERAVDDALTAELPVDERQLVIIDDGSTDGTRELLRERQWPENMTLVFHERNRGKGAAPPDRPPARHRTVVGDPRRRPRVPSGRPRPAAPATPPGRREGGLRDPLLVEPLRVQLLVRDGEQCVTLATNVIYNCFISDVMTCHKAMSTELFRSLRLRERGFAIEPEIAARVLRAGERIRGADHLRGALARGGQEAHRGRRASRATDACPLPRGLAAGG